MFWRLLNEFSSGIFNLEFDIIPILQTGVSADILKMGFRYKYESLFQPPFMIRKWILTLLLS